MIFPLTIEPVSALGRVPHLNPPRWTPPRLTLCPIPLWAALVSCLLWWAGAGFGAAVAQEPAASSTSRHSPLVRAVQKARPSVVNIHGRKVVRSEPTHQQAGRSGQDDGFRQVNGMGTGVVIDERGYIITNYHVVEGVGRIQVTLANKRTVIARLLEHDPKTDLAIIKVDVDEEMAVIQCGNSHDLMPGETVAAVGNAFGYEHTVTRGIISALNRTVQVTDDQTYANLIQTDASINPGNSGGPLLNIHGEMIGINVAVRVGAQGIGFAIPIDEAMKVAARLLSSEKLSQIRHGIRGEHLSQRADEGHVGPAAGKPDKKLRFVVKSAAVGSPAHECGLKAGDIIRSIGGRQVEHAVDVERAFLGRRGGEEVEIKIQRGPNLEQTQTLLLTVESINLQQFQADRFWTMLGVRLRPIPQSDFRRYKTRYRGGLRVEAVRPGSPASRQGIRFGDVLVGMHKWETISLDNMHYVLNHFEKEPPQPIKFYILRGAETLYGHLSVAMKTR